MKAILHWAESAWLVAAFIFVAPMPTSGQQLTYYGSMQLTTGDYFFTETTRTVYLSSGLTAELGRLTLSATVPIVLQNSPWISYSVVGAIPTGGTDQSAVSRRRGGSGTGQGSGPFLQKSSDFVDDLSTKADSVVPVDTVSYSQLGVGDPGLRMDLDVIRPSNGPLSVRVSASCKPPLADVDRGFGTGSWDGGIGVGSSIRIGRVFVFAGGEYWWFGDMPDLILKNALSYSAAVGLPVVPSRLSALVSYSGITRIIESGEPTRQVGLGLSLTMNRTFGLSLSVSLGATESTPDVSVGAGWTVKI